MSSEKIPLLYKLVYTYLPNDLLHHIKEYAFFDISSKAFMKYVKKNKMPYLRLIQQCYSRKNGFYGFDESDTEEEHWVFGGIPTETINLQAVNCSICGQYKHVLPFHIKYNYCTCDENFDDLPDLIAIFAEEWENADFDAN